MGARKRMDGVWKIRTGYLGNSSKRSKMLQRLHTCIRAGIHMGNLQNENCLTREGCYQIGSTTVDWTIFMLRLAPVRFTSCRSGSEIISIPRAN